jgi:hypothetical protein
MVKKQTIIRLGEKRIEEIAGAYLNWMQPPFVEKCFWKVRDEMLDAQDDAVRAFESGKGPSIDLDEYRKPRTCSVQITNLEFAKYTYFCMGRCHSPSAAKRVEYIHWRDYRILEQLTLEGYDLPITIRVWRLWDYLGDVDYYTIGHKLEQKGFAVADDSHTVIEWWAMHRLKGLCLPIK